MFGAMQQCRGQPAKMNFSKKSVQQSAITHRNSENFMKKTTNSRRRRAEISSIKRAQRHLLIDSENRPPMQQKKTSKQEQKEQNKNVKVKKKKKRRNRNGRNRGVSLTSLCGDEFRIIFACTEVFSDNDMSDHSGGGQLPIKKRGHQHHPRFAGHRRSNVPAEEVLAALRRGGIVEMSKIMRATADILVDFAPRAEETDELEGQQQASDISRNTQEAGGLDLENQIVVQAEQQPHEAVRMPPSALVDGDEDDDDVQIVESQEDFNRNVIGCEAEAVHDSDNNRIAGVGDTATSALPDVHINLNPSNTSLPSSCSITPTTEDQTIASPAQEIKTKSSKSSNRDKSSKSSRSEEKRRRKQQRESKQHTDGPPKQERSAGDGAPADDCGDMENDPEAEEWARLRCTSERTEVVAERENRRHKGRCSDYPGLAFGRSIFSSDTMMKFSIIRNELHNIMNTQLKRVTNVPI